MPNQLLTASATCDIERVKGRLLIVEDDLELLRFLQQVLETLGFDVETSASSLRAVELVSQGSFDVILSDICMPGLDGLELVRTLRESDYDIPVVLITGKPSVETIMSAADLGVFKYLTKPVYPMELRETMSRAFNARRMARATTARSKKSQKGH